MTVQSVADDILKLATRRGKLLTPMQLIKLAYISYGWHLAMTGGRLFGDRIKSWKYGRVIPNLYHLTKRFGHAPIPAALIADSSLSHPDLEKFLSGVVEKYGRFSGVALSNLTHRPGTPWYKAFRPNTFGAQIPDKFILEHYKQDLNRGVDRAHHP